MARFPDWCGALRDLSSFGLCVRDIASDCLLHLLVSVRAAALLALRVNFYEFCHVGTIARVNIYGLDRHDFPTYYMESKGNLA